MPSSGLCSPRASAASAARAAASAAVEIAHADRIDLAVVALDAADRILRQLDRGDFLRGQRGRQFDGGPETPLRFGQGMLLICLCSEDDAQFGAANDPHHARSLRETMLSWLTIAIVPQGVTASPSYAGGLMFETARCSALTG